jgi:hypothetical protein
MLRRFKSPFLLLITGSTVLALQAQQTAQKPTVYIARPFAYLLPSVPTVSGAPVTATFAVRLERPLAGGGARSLKSMTLVARDSDGRIRRELHEYVPESTSGEPRLICMVLDDPRSRTRQVLDPILRSDSKQSLMAVSRSSSTSGSATTEDLGSKIIDGLEVQGARRTWTIPSQLDDSGQPVQVVEETWFSNQLQMIVSQRRTDSFGRLMTITMSHFDRGEPAASLFKAPHGYGARGRGQVPGSSGSTWSTTPPDYDPIGSEGCCILPISR